MSYSHILFDLDGTLIDSKETIRCSFEYALKKMKVPNPKVTNVDALIGPPMLKTFEAGSAGFHESQPPKGDSYALS